MSQVIEECKLFLEIEGVLSCFSYEVRGFSCFCRLWKATLFQRSYSCYAQKMWEFIMRRYVSCLKFAFWSLDILLETLSYYECVPHILWQAFSHVSSILCLLVLETLRKCSWLQCQVGVIGNLVHSSVNIKKEVLAAGALQPVIGLLRYLLTQS